MSLEDRVFFVDRKIHSPSENLAINALSVDLVKEGTYDFITRVYKHSPGVILGMRQSIADVDISYCDKLGYEVVKRPTGGSAVVVDPNGFICYSVFLNMEKLGIKGGPHPLYKAITFPLAQNLGENVFVEGTYYLRYKSNGSNIPFGGHAIKVHKKPRKADVYQFDGIINLESFDLENLSKLLKLRELYYLDGKKYVVVEGAVYDKDGNYVDLDFSSAERRASEKDELAKIIGLREIGINEETFIKKLYNSLQRSFGELRRVNEIPLNVQNIKQLSHHIKRNSKREGGCVVGLGHCFVDFVEPEPLLIA